MVSDECTPEIPAVPMKTCTKCGETKPITEFWFHRTKTNPQARRARCKPCETADHAAYVDANRSQMNAYAREFRVKHHARHLTKKRAWTQKNREKVNAQWRAHFPRYKEKYADVHRAYRKTHSTEITWKVRQWQRKNPEKVVQHIARYLTQKAQAAINDFTTAQWHEMKTALDHRCVYCDRQMERLTIDHLTPVSQGGNHTLWNILPACQSCNSRKHTGTPLKPVQPFLLTISKPKTRTKT